MSECNCRPADQDIRRNELDFGNRYCNTCRRPYGPQVNNDSVADDIITIGEHLAYESWDDDFGW